MYTARRKIHKDKDVEPTEFEDTVAQSLFDLENTNQELKSDLKDMYINSAAQFDISGNKKAVVIHVPYRLRKSFRKIHVRLVRELEKKFSGKDVVLIATRRILRPPKKGSAVVRPRSRTLTVVNDAILEDIVYPAEIVGKRIRYRLDGSKITKANRETKYWMRREVSATHEELSRWLKDDNASGVGATTVPLEIVNLAIDESGQSFPNTEWVSMMDQYDETQQETAGAQSCSPSSTPSRSTSKKKKKTIKIF